MFPSLFSFSSTGIEYSVGANASNDCTVFSAPCPHCGRKTLSKKLRPIRAYVFHAQKKWPDILTCFTAGSAVSDRVLADLHEAGIGGFDTYPVELTDIPASKPCPWRYWLLDPKGRAAFDPVLESDAARALVCTKCSVWESHEFRTAGILLPQNHLRVGSWHGEDFVWAFHEDCHTRLCSARVIDLACRKQWTNFDFRPFGNGYYEVHVKHRDPNWRSLLEERLRQIDAGMPAAPVAAPVAGADDVSTESSAPAHPFDDLADDGTACQGQVELAAGFGLCDLLVFPDGDDGPSDEQRELFDAFVAGQEEWLPELRRKLAAILRKASKQGEIALAEPLPARVRDFAAFSRWLGSPDVSIGEQDDEAGEAVELSYPILGTDHVALARVRPGAEPPVPRVTVSVQPWDMTETGGKLVRNADGSESIVFFKNRGVTLDDEGPVGDVQE